MLAVYFLPIILKCQAVQVQTWPSFSFLTISMFDMIPLYTFSVPLKSKLILHYSQFVSFDLGRREGKKELSLPIALKLTKFIF